MADDAPCDLGAWRDLYAQLNVPWRDPASDAPIVPPAYAPPRDDGLQSDAPAARPAFAPPVTADGWGDGAVESAFDALIGADAEQREGADSLLCRRRKTTPRVLYAATDSRDGSTAPAPLPQPEVPLPRPKLRPRPRVDKLMKKAPSMRPALPGCLQPPTDPTMESLFGEEEEEAAPPAPAPKPAPKPPPPPPRHPHRPRAPAAPVPRRLQPRVGLTTFSKAGTSLRPKWGTVGARPAAPTRIRARAPAAKLAPPAAAAAAPPAKKKKKKPRMPSCLVPPPPPPGVTMEGLFGEE